MILVVVLIIIATIGRRAEQNEDAWRWRDSARSLELARLFQPPARRGGAQRHWGPADHPAHTVQGRGALVWDCVDRAPRVPLAPSRIRRLAEQRLRHRRDRMVGQ